MKRLMDRSLRSRIRRSTPASWDSTTVIRRFRDGGRVEIPAEITDAISVDPRICHGKPCFKSTRIMVATVLELLEAGHSYQEIRKGYPTLTPRHLRAALRLACHTVEQGWFAPCPTASHAAAR